MFYYRLRSTGEVLGAGTSSAQSADWKARYASALGIDAGDIEAFESETDPRPADARKETAVSSARVKPLTGAEVEALRALLAERTTR